MVDRTTQPGEIAEKRQSIGGMSEASSTEADVFATPTRSAALPNSRSLPNMLDTATQNPFEAGAMPAPPQPKKNTELAMARIVFNLPSWQTRDAQMLEATVKRRLSAFKEREQEDRLRNCAKKGKKECLFSRLKKVKSDVRGTGDSKADCPNCKEKDYCLYVLEVPENADDGKLWSIHARS